MPKTVETTELQRVQQTIRWQALELEALRLCLSNYEGVIKEHKAATLAESKRASKAEVKLERLIHLVKHNAKNASTIINQLTRPKKG